MNNDVQRFFAYVDFNDCWEWLGGLDRGGYGQFRYKGTTHRSHRVAYELCGGELIKGLDLDHLCRNRRCVNPSHLEQVTRSTNLLRGHLWQSKKTECPNGHPYDMVDSRGARRCLECYRVKARIRSQQYYRRKKNAQNLMLGR